MDFCTSCTLSDIIQFSTAAGHSLPPLTTLFQTTQSPLHMSLSIIHRIFSNPFTLSPLLFTSCLIFTEYFVEMYVFYPRFLPSRHSDLCMFRQVAPCSCRRTRFIAGDSGDFHDCLPSCCSSGESSTANCSRARIPRWAN